MSGPTSPAAGDVLYTSNGQWSGSPTSYSYLWQHCDTNGANCSAASGAPNNASRYVVASGDNGSTIRSQVTATYAGGQTAVQQSEPTVMVAGPQAAYPSVLGTNGRNVVDANGYQLGGPGKPTTMKGLNIQIDFGPQSQADYNTMATKGCRLHRLVVHWDQLEPTQGVIDTTHVANFLDPNITRMITAAQNANQPMYAFINFYFGPSGTHAPTWLAQRTDTATVTSGSPTVVDAAITAADQGRVVTSTGITSTVAAYVGTVTPGVSFLLSSAPDSQATINANGNSASVTVGGSKSSINNLFTYGQTAIQFLADRYGKPSSPQYTPAIIGIGVNEPVPDNLNAPNMYATLETEFRTVVNWFRASAPQWVWFMAYAFALGSPLPNLTPAGHASGQTFNAADPHAFDSVGGNWCVDLHDGILAVASTTAVDDGRNSVGSSSIWAPCATGSGNRITTASGASGSCPNGLYDISTYPVTYAGVTDRTQAQSQFTAHVYPYKLWCGPSYANVPLLIGECMEWSSVLSPASPNGTNWVDDKMTVHLDAGAFGQCEWDYGTNQVQDVFAAHPGIGTLNADTDGWLITTNHWLAS